MPNFPKMKRMCFYNVTEWGFSATVEGISSTSNIQIEIPPELRTALVEAGGTSPLIHFASNAQVR